VGDQYELYQAGRFNDTAVLIGTNSDEGALFSRGEVTPEKFESDVRSGYGERADTILAAYPHATVAEATRSTKNIARESTFAWHTWAWARLLAQKGTGEVYLYYFDYHQPHSPEGASHGTEMGYVFRNLEGPGGALSHLKGSPNAQDIGVSDVVSTTGSTSPRPAARRRWSAAAGLYDRRSAGDVLERKVEVRAPCRAGEGLGRSTPTTLGGVPRRRSSTRR
jgi:carboxylesterase type B